MMLSQQWLYARCQEYYGYTLGYLVFMCGTYSMEIMNANAWLVGSNSGLNNLEDVQGVS